MSAPFPDGKTAPGATSSVIFLDADHVSRPARWRRMDEESSGIGPVATLLGYAGLLPAIFAVVLVALGEPAGIALALVYGAAILSFLGGIWWGLSMRCARQQPAIIGLSVVPSLVASATLLAALATETYRAPLVVLGIAVMLTLPIDDWLAKKGAAPAGWMRLRIPLSVGLAALIFLVAILSPVPMTRY